MLPLSEHSLSLPSVRCSLSWIKFISREPRCKAAVICLYFEVQQLQESPLKTCWLWKQQQLPPVIFLFLFFNPRWVLLPVGCIIKTPPPSFPPRRAPGVFEASATSFCSYLVWSGPVAPGWRAEGGRQASGEESPGFLLVWEAWRRITKRGHEILKQQGAERWANAQTERHTETHSHTTKIQRNTQKHMHS